MARRALRFRLHVGVFSPVSAAGLWARDTGRKRARNRFAQTEPQTSRMLSSPPPRRGRAREPHATRSLDTPAAFRDSMPERYRRSFDGAEMREHAGIVGRRGDAPAHAELWRRLPNGGAILCIVAEDRPGLLSFISAALGADKMDVVSAQAYTRMRAGRTAEAVDLLWVRRDGEPVRSADAVRVAEVLRALVTGKIALDSITRQTHPAAPTTSAGGARVTFSEPSDEGPSVLLVEAVDRPGLLLAITLALFRASIQIVASDAASSSGRVVDRFTVAELDGTAITRNRRGAVQAAVQASLDALSARSGGV